MAFKDNVRLEQIYFSNLKKTIKALNDWKQTETVTELSDVLNSCIESNEAILLLYKNIGECWNDLSSFIAADRAKLEELAGVVSSEKDEINAKIDDVNNYLVNRLATVEERLDNLERHVYDNYVEKVLFVEEDGNTFRIRDFNDETKYYTYDDLFEMFYNEQIKPALYYVDVNYYEILSLSCINKGDGDIVFSTVNFGDGGLFHYEVKVYHSGTVYVSKTMMQQGQ